MKIAVIGGTGMVGSRIVAEASGRGHEVVAVSRKGDAPAAGNVTALALDATEPGARDALRELAGRVDAVVSAIGPSREAGGDPNTFTQTLLSLAEAVKPTRLLVVGGAGSLYAAPGVRLLDTPEFPPEYLAEATAAADSLAALRGLADAGEWSYLSPAPVIAPGERTGSYRVGEDSPAGEHVSAEDFAVALVDEIENPAHRNTRWTVAN